MRNDLITMKGGTPVPAKGSALISVSKGVSAIRKPLEELAGKMQAVDRCRHDLKSSILHLGSSTDELRARREMLIPRAQSIFEARKYLAGIFDFEPSLVLKMLSVLYGALSRKGGDSENTQMLILSVARIFDPVTASVGATTGLWKNVPRHPVILALAIEYLLLKSTFAPTPSEVFAACELARDRLREAVHEAWRWMQRFLENEAVFLKRCPDEWRRAYLRHYELWTDVLLLLEHKLDVDQVKDAKLKDLIGDEWMAVEREYPTPDDEEDIPTIVACAQKPPKKTQTVKQKRKPDGGPSESKTERGKTDAL